MTLINQVECSQIEFLTRSGAVSRAVTDNLQSEIQIARADNSILRQDIQVFRQRESQLYQRNIELEEQLIESNKEITKIAKTLHGGPKGTEDGARSGL